MKVRGIAAFAAALILSVVTTALLAQESAKEPETTREHADSTGTKSMGTTGWTGGNRGQTKEKAGSRAMTGEDQDSAADQPEMATGLDLKGRPTRFPAEKTPE